MKTVRKLLASISLLLALTGCAQPEALESIEPAPTNSQADPAPSQSETPSDETLPIECNPGVQAEIETTVNSQTTAFAENNFELAYSYASASFRSNVTLDSFVAIIAGSYGPLIDSSDLSFSECLVNDNSGLALINVRFLKSGKGVYALRYLMSDTSEGWRVEGASNLEVVGEGT